MASEDATYSASVEDWETDNCNLEHQEMGPPASKKMEPEMEQWLSGSMALSGLGETGEKHTSRARDAASATQAECCALHHTCVPYLSDGVLAVLSRRKGGNLVDIRTSCIRL